MTVLTDSHIDASRPVMIIKDKMNSTCKLIDMSASCDSNVSIIEMEKNSRLKDFEIQIQNMWKMETELIPFVTRALGTSMKE